VEFFAECLKAFGSKAFAWQYTDNCHDYAFNNGELDCSILIDEDLIYLENASSATKCGTIRPSSAEIQVLQNELNVQGFKDNNGNSLQVDGVAGELTLSALPMLKTGCEGNITKWLQIQVGTTADGAFGEETRQAVIVFQENHSIDGDGIVGKNTWRKILKL
jgi:peptidoglycan hydrolase-like protein with peptidoglycan-binding domain